MHSDENRLFLIQRRACTGGYDKDAAADIAYLLNRFDLAQRDASNMSYAADVNYRKWQEAARQLERQRLPESE